MSTRATRTAPFAKLRVVLSQGSGIFSGLARQSQAVTVCAVAAPAEESTELAPVVVGQEARVAIFAGRPIGPSDIGPPALIDRNQIVLLTYRKGAITIVTEGRAMGRGGVGDLVRVMNLASRTTVSGHVAEDGTIRVIGGN